ncbi:MAG: CHAD domain-containing protein [Haliscomenobacter sp.]|nr:CHAD domain-containing protein [Haliscomenobacter sp.]
MQRQLLEYYRGLCKDFHRLFLEVNQAYGRDTVHDLRVNLKKQMAFYRFLEAVEPPFSAKEAKASFGELYDLAGKVRDLQVERSLLRKTVRLDSLFASWLKQREAAYKTLLQEYEKELTLAPVRRLERTVESAIQAIHPGIALDCFERFLKTLLEKIRETLKGTGAVERLHYLRKRIKDLYFNLHMLELLIPETSLPKKNIKALDKFQTLLGNWHDLDFIRELLREEPHACSSKIRHKVDKEHAKATEKTVSELGGLGAILDELEQVLEDALHAARLAHLIEGGEQRPAINNSFHQKNMEEGIK